MVQTTNQWILERTGYRSGISPNPMSPPRICGLRSADALDQRGIDAQELDCILVCTVTPDMLFPSTACLVQHKLGVKGAWGFDLIAACSGFLYGLTTGAHLVTAGTHRQGARDRRRHDEPHHRLPDRSTCILFGDGAGAMLPRALRRLERRRRIHRLPGEIDGAGGDYLKMPAGGSRMPATLETVQQRMHYVHQDGQQVFRYARAQDVRGLPRSAGAQRPHRR